MVFVGPSVCPQEDQKVSEPHEPMSTEHKVGVVPPGAWGGFTEEGAGSGLSGGACCVRNCRVGKVSEPRASLWGEE